MSNVSIGITAMELFAYNPFRILGIPVNATHAEIESTYQKLEQLASSNEIEGYKTPYDFESLPPFTRSAQTVKTARAKLASNGYRCFAYADSEFSISLNIDDIALNLRDITCYDCFLRCYMWLIINDREMMERDLWIQLAKYIDKLIMSSPDEWPKYFDNRFPDELIDPNMSMYKSFYGTFCEIILLPLKEMVRGSMKCRSASEILECAKIDINEEFEFIDIPQANPPEAGEPAPKLKLALKYGDEYFDIKTGTMKSYSTDTEAKESNSFAEAANAPLAADDLIDEPIEEEITEEESAIEQSAEVADAEYIEQTTDLPSEEEPTNEPVSEQAPIPAPAPAPTPAPAPKLKSRAERKAEREAAATEKEAKTVPKATEPVAPKPEPLTVDTGTPAPAPTIPPQPAQSVQQAKAPAKPAAPRRTFRDSLAQQENGTAAKSSATTVDFSTSNPFAAKTEKKSDDTEKPKSRRSMEFTKVVQEAAKKEAAEPLSEEEEEALLYTNALIEMLKSNQTREETMRSVDTHHVARDVDLTAPAPKSAQMDAINLDNYDENRLAAAKDPLVGRKLTREEKYRNVKIDDMLGTNNPGKSYGTSAVDEYKKKKAEEKARRKSFFTFIGIVVLCVIIILIMWLGGII